MNLLSLYHFFAGKASDKQKEAIKRWAESSPDNYETLCREKKIFDAGILLVDKKELFQKENAPLLYKLINYTVKIAAVVLLVVVSVTIYKYQELVKKSEVLQTILVPAGQRINIILPDSTFVCLNSNTKFSYPSVFATNNRKVKLDGEAYFEVSKNPKKPFRVKANGVTIRVLGTHFNVNAYAADSLVETTLLEGSVSVSNNANGKQMILKPNETAIYRKSTGILSMHINANAQNEISWREGVLSFNDISMGEIARQLSHHFNVTIQIKSEQLRNYKLNARFKQNETLEEILEMLAPIVGFTYHMPQSNLIELKQEN